MMKKLLTLATLVLVIACACTKKNTNPSEKLEKEDDKKEETLAYPSYSKKIVADMGAGWNLGNTLDTKNSDKTYWGNPETTKTMIDAIRAKGFKTLRVPITWQYNISAAPEYTIEKKFLDRVEEIVNYGLDNDMYVIINIHHDEEIISPTKEKFAQSIKAVTRIWEQTAEHFKEYGDHLIFESLNEMRVKGTKEEWTGGTAESRDCINKYHEAMVKAVRQKGENNAKRQIMLSPYAASSAPNAIDGLVLPKDNNIIVAIHSYFPYNFAMNADAAKGSTKEWGSNNDKKEMNAEFDRIYWKFIKKDIPVVMGEWGSVHKDNLSARVAHAKYYVEGCKIKGICPIWWDNGKVGTGSDTYALYDRKTNSWVHEEIADAIVNAAK